MTRYASAAGASQAGLDSIRAPTIIGRALFGAGKGGREACRQEYVGIVQGI